MKIVQGKDVLIDKWNQLLNDSIYSSPFQGYEFYDFFNRVKGYSADVFAVEAEGVYVAIIVVTTQKEKSIKSYFSRRGIVYGGPLFHSKVTENQITELLKYINGYYKKKLIYIEVRNNFDYSAFNETFLNSGWSYIPYLNFQIRCDNREKVIEKFNRRRRREIKIAQEAGTTICEAKTIEELRDLYNIIADLYKNKIKKPIFPLVFFEHFFTTNLCKVILVKAEDTVIGGVICIKDENRGVYGWYGAGLDKEYKKNSPVVMGIYGAIMYAFDNNYLFYDFMGAGKPEEKYGVRKFKEEFGGDLVEYGRYLKIVNKLLYKLGKLYITFKSTK